MARQPRNPHAPGAKWAPEGARNNAPGAEWAPEGASKGPPPGSGDDYSENYSDPGFEAEGEIEMSWPDGPDAQWGSEGSHAPGALSAPEGARKNQPGAMSAHEGATKNHSHASILEAFDAAEDEGPERSDGDLSDEWRSDMGNARRYVARHARELMYVREIGWLAWDRKRWAVDHGEPIRRAHKTAEAMVAEALAIKDRGPRSGEDARAFEARWKAHYAHAIASSQHGACKAMIASAEPYLTRKREDLDAVPWRFNVANGTLHLEDPAQGGKAVRLFHPRRSDHATLLADVTYEPGAKRTRFDRFIAEVMPDRDARLWLQKWLGYCLTGDTSEQCVAVFEGKGANGKSTLVDVVARLMGDYAATTPVESFLHQERRSGAAPSPDLARLAGVRLVRTSEPEPGARLSESVIKQWTGGEKFAARFLHKEFFEFKPAGKLTMSVNIRPVIVGKDFGIRRRIKVVPFRQQFPRTAGLGEALLAERSGILNWLLDGYALWREDGLGSCREIDEATRAYFAEMDPIGSFVEEACEQGPQLEDFFSDIEQAYRRWCVQSGEEEKKHLGRRLSDMGFGARKSGGISKRLGIKVKAEWRGSVGGRGEDA